MRFEKVLPGEQLRPHIKYYVISENSQESQYTVFPSTGLVIGFQYRGRLSVIKNEAENQMSTAGITGMSNEYKIFKNSADIGTVLVYFTETGFNNFTFNPANELFNQSISLDDIFDKHQVAETEERLELAGTDTQRIRIVEQFLLSQLKDVQHDRLIMEAVRFIYDSKGAIRIRDLNEKLNISQSPFEKRFRKVVGISPKKFSSIVRFNSVLDDLNTGKSLADICYENKFFDQSHFIKDFRQYTGETPEKFKPFL
jgi:AraC-like DNA-binding protein